MSVAASRQEQLDIEAVLDVMTELEDITVVSEFRGVTENEIDNLLGGSAVKAPKLAGAVLLVTQPEERANDKSDSVLVDSRTHMVRIIEQVKVNRKPGWESDTAKLACGMTCDELKDLVKQGLHMRKISGGTLTHLVSEPYADTKGGLGWDVKFHIAGQLATEARAATPRISQGTTAGTQAVVVFNFTGYTAAGCELFVDGDSLGSILAGGTPGEIPAGIATPSGWTRATAGALLTFTCATVGDGHYAGANGVGIVVTTTDGEDPEPSVILTGSGASGEELRYTTDGSTPVPSGATVEDYSAPVTGIAAGTLVRASATATGKALSDFTQKTIT